MANEQGTETQPAPNISTENHGVHDASPTTTQPAPNISTEYQQPGDARRPNDTLGRDQPQEQDDGGRKTSLTGG